MALSLFIRGAGSGLRMRRYHSLSVNKYSNFERQLATAGVDRTMNWYLHKRRIASTKPTHVSIVSRVSWIAVEVKRRGGGGQHLSSYCNIIRHIKPLVMSFSKSMQNLRCYADARRVQILLKVQSCSRDSEPVVSQYLLNTTVFYGNCRHRAIYVTIERDI